MNDRIQNNLRNSYINLALQLGPLLVYFLAYFIFKKSPLTLFGTTYTGIASATLVFIPTLLLSVLLTWILFHKLPKFTIFSALLIIFFGGLTIYFNDDRFAKIRPSLVYLLLATLLGVGLARGVSYIQFLIDDFLDMLFQESSPLETRGWMIFTRNFMIFFILMLFVNEATWRFLGDAAWVFFDSFGQMILSALFFATQMPIFVKYANENSTQGEPKK